VHLAFNLANCAIFVLILVGTVLHHRRTFHVRMMVTCFVLDLLLLLGVEIVNHAVERVVSGGLGPLLIVHIALAVATLVLWAVQIVLGRKILQGRREFLPAHNKGSRIFLLARFGICVTAFLV
jgi:hypothetical protein